MIFFNQPEITWEVKDEDGRQEVGDNAVCASSQEFNNEISRQCHDINPLPLDLSLSREALFSRSLGNT
jgi:hypothetical protein